MILENNWQDVISVIKANSSEINLAERADVLIAELVGHFFFEEGIVEYVSHVRDRFFKRDARIIPEGARVFMSAVELGEYFQEVSFWKSWSDPRLSSVCKRAVNTVYVERIHKEQLLAPQVEIFRLDSRSWRSERRRAEFDFFVERSGRLDALAGWFELNLTGCTTLGTSPYDPPTHWMQCVFPLEKPIFLSHGDRVQCEITVDPFGPGCRWGWNLASTPGHNRWDEVHEFEITYSDRPRLFRERF